MLGTRVGQKVTHGRPAPLPLAFRGAWLGAYQAGASAALLVGLDHLRNEAGLDVRVDAVGGASAGAIVGLMAAFAVLEGIDGRDIMRRAWVERVS